MIRHIHTSKMRCWIFWISLQSSARWESLWRGIDGGSAGAMPSVDRGLCFSVFCTENHSCSGPKLGSFSQVCTSSVTALCSCHFKCDLKAAKCLLLRAIITFLGIEEHMDTMGISLKSVRETQHWRQLRTCFADWRQKWVGLCPLL